MQGGTKQARPIYDLFILVQEAVFRIFIIWQQHVSQKITNFTMGVGKIMSVGETVFSRQFRLPYFLNLTGYTSHRQVAVTILVDRQNNSTNIPALMPDSMSQRMELNEQKTHQKQPGCHSVKRHALLSNQNKRFPFKTT